jgi:hypothetical protein
VERRPALSILRLVYTTTPGFKSTRLHQHPSAVSGLRVLAPVSGLSFSRIQPARLPTDPGLQRATKDSSSSLLSGLRVLAPVSGLLSSRIQPARLPTDPGLRRATKDSSSGLLRDHTLRSSLHGYLRIYCCKRLLALAPLSCKRPPAPGDYSVTTALAT